MLQIFLAPRQANLERNDGPTVDEEKHPLEVYAYNTPTRSFVGNVKLDSVKVYEDILKRYPADRLLTKIHPAPEGAASQTVRTHQLSSDGYEAWCVPCLVQKDFEGNREMTFLVLTPLNVGRREYQRIGMMNLYGKACDMFMAVKDVHEDREIIHIL